MSIANESETMMIFRTNFSMRSRPVFYDEGELLQIRIVSFASALSVHFSYDTTPGDEFHTSILFEQILAVATVTQYTKSSLGKSFTEEELLGRFTNTFFGEFEKTER
ncbi:hypothetical protein RUM44_005262 [Polyplax serrata]|uniref:Uncharacterized protein n=1 Tax=Polyplax serrata TaxID=468196 RepID=A0ABR1AEK2_POLSC